MQIFKESRIIMGMPVAIEIVGEKLDQAAAAAEDAFEYFNYVDRKFSTYKDDSEISQINAGLLQPADYSSEMREVLLLCQQTKQQTQGYFDILRPGDGKLDPSGLVKGWAIRNAAKLIIENFGFKNFYIDAGGDIQAQGLNSAGQPWQIGIRNPFNREQIIKIVPISNAGMATSGAYLRGAHIYNPKTGQSAPAEVASLTVLGPDVYEADRFATAAYAMGKEGLVFIENLPGFEGYLVDGSGQATMTTGFENGILKS